ncbi:MAG TPA: SUMF1/EgtB/PvdO family nonheme iron enzyme, partial [Kofleriaceae bacterium]|nr:SUMF1/EgtB/PvdO family nonheme iron enzyme [Kofleriaceae bacterium]
PHGDALAPDQANVDETYGRRSDAFGPDEVGSHPASRSPLGIDDMAGNVWEWVTGPGGAPVARGGSFYYTTTIARIANRETPVAEYRDISVGMRVCSSVVKPPA